jgi:hypothetical protein
VLSGVYIFQKELLPTDISNCASALYMKSSENLLFSCRFRRNLLDPCVNWTIGKLCSKAFHDAKVLLLWHNRSVLFFVTVAAKGKSDFGKPYLVGSDRPESFQRWTASQGCPLPYLLFVRKEANKSAHIELLLNWSLFFWASLFNQKGWCRWKKKKLRIWLKTNYYLDGKTAFFAPRRQYRMKTSILTHGNKRV